MNGRCAPPRWGGLILLLLLLLAPVASAQDSNPTIAILGFPVEVKQLQTSALLDVLQGYGMINQDERDALNEYEDVAGESLTIAWGSAELDLADASIVVERAIDQGADALVVFSTSMSQLAVNLTRDMPNPPVVIFQVADPYAAGLADATCIKPAHVTGTHTSHDYELIFDVLQLQLPDLATVGVLYSLGHAVGEVGQRKATAVAQSRGIEVISASVAEISEVGFAANGLISKEVDAIIMPSSAFITAAMPIAVEAAKEFSVPVVSPTLGTIFLGVTFGIGNYRNLQEGYDVGRVLVAWLNGEADIARTGINTISDTALGINLNSAALAEIEVSEELIAMADAIVVGDKYQMSPKMARDAFQYMDMPDEMIMMIVQAANIPGLEIVEERIQAPLATVVGEAAGFATGSFSPNPEMDAAFVAGLECTDEMIAEQQAALDAADE